MKINEKRVFGYFKDLASISSPSWNESGVIEYIEKYAAQRSIKTKRFSCGKSFNLLLTLSGRKKNVEPVLFSAHTDTVVPCDSIKVVETAERFQSDGRTILGGDDKAALAAFLEAIDVLAENNIEHPDVEFLLTCAEEVGLCGMKGMDASKLKSKRGFVFDSDGDVGAATVRAPYQVTMKVEITGKAAHAGMNPERGFSAIYAAADMINSFPQGRIDSETTTNVGKISGGMANNIVAEKAVFELECRSLNKAKLKSLEKEIIKAIKSVAKKRKVKADIESVLEYCGYSFRENDKMIKTFIGAAKNIGLKPVLKSSGGGSDTNILNGCGIKALNLSVGMMNVHTTSEYLEKKNLVRAASMVVSLLQVIE